MTSLPCRIADSPHRTSAAACRRATAERELNVSRCAPLVVAAAATFLAPLPVAAQDVDTLLVLTGEAAGDYFGGSVASAGDMNGDGFADVIVGAYRGGGLHAGRAYVYHGGPGADAVADLVLTGESSSDSFGYSVASAGDVNGDGFADVIVGAPLNDAGGPSAGRVYVYYGGAGADAVADLVMTGEASGKFGHSVASAGDMNGDTFADVIVGARGWPSNTFTGRAYVYFGGGGADSVADLVMTGEAPNDEFGSSVASAGDVNGDTFADVIVGAHGNDAGGLSAGRVYVYYGGPGADAVADLVLTGEAHSSLGWTVASAGDVNGDTFADVIAGAYSYPDVLNFGAAFVYYGSSNPDTVADVMLTGEAADDYFCTVASAGDVDGDTLEDVIVGASYNDAGGDDAGRAYIFSLGTGSSVDAAVGAVPEGTVLVSVKPNPFGSEVRIGFTTSRSGPVRLQVYDARGGRVRSLADGARDSGRHEIAWDGRTDLGRRLPSGIYFVRLEAEGYAATRKVVLLR